MAATKLQIKKWVEQGFSDPDVTHVLVVCDTFDWDDYPVSVYNFENINERVTHYSGNMQKVMEIYSKKLPLGDQLNEQRAWHPKDE